MAKNKIIILSDCHIGGNEPTNWYQQDVHEGYISAILEYVASNADSIHELILLGDLVDFWTYPPHLEAPEFETIVSRNPKIFGSDGMLREALSALDGEIVFLNGNHDMTLHQSDLDRISDAKGRCIKVARDGIYLPPAGNGHIVCGHGHLYSMLCAPDMKASPASGLPLGYFVTRIAAYRDVNLLRKKKKKNVAELRYSGAPTGWAFDLKNFLGIAETLIKGDLCLSDLIINGLLEATGLPENTCFKLPGGKSVSMREVKEKYDMLFTNWKDKYGGTKAAVDMLWNVDYSNNLAPCAFQLAGETRARVVVLGHTHVPVEKEGLERVSGHTEFLYANAGLNCRSILELENEGKYPTFVEIEIEPDGQYSVSVRGVVRDGETYKLLAEPLKGPERI